MPRRILFLRITSNYIGPYVELRFVIKESDGLGGIVSEGVSYTYYGVDGDGIQLGERVLTGQGIGISVAFLTEINCIGVRVQVCKGDKDITSESFKLNYDTHPIVVAATRAGRETNIIVDVDLLNYSWNEVAEIARGIGQGRFSVIGEVGILPSLPSGALKRGLFKGVDVLTAPQCLRNGLIVLAQHEDILVSPMRGKVVVIPAEVRHIIDIAVLLENGDVLCLGGVVNAPLSGKTVKTGEVLGFVADTSGVVVATFSSHEHIRENSPGYYLNLPNLMESLVW